MQLRRVIGSVCRVSAAILFLILTATIASSIPTVSINEITVEKSGIVATGSLLILDLDHVAGVKLNITYDPKVTKIIGDQSTFSASSNFGIITANLEHSDSGWITLAAVAASPGLNSPVKIADLTFLAVGEPGSSTPIVVNVIDLVNYTNNGAKPNQLKPGEYVNTESIFKIKAASGVPTANRADASITGIPATTTAKSTPAATITREIPETPVQTSGTPAATSAATVPESTPEGAQTPSSPGFDAWILILLVAVYVFLSKVKG